MLHKLGVYNLPTYFLKTILGVIIVLGVFGIETNTYAYQELPPRPSGSTIPVIIKTFGCFKRTCTITTSAGTDHYVTIDGTASCNRGVFAWDNITNPQIGQTVKEAIRQRKTVQLRYSEYHCYDGSQEGVGRPMELQAIWILY